MLKVGDVVILKSRGPAMTLSQFTNQGEWLAMWFDGTKLKKDFFHPDELYGPLTNEQLVQHTQLYNQEK